MNFNWRALIGLEKSNVPASTGLGPDFPDSAGDRERGKFRPSKHPRLTKIAVTLDEDDLEEVTKSTDKLLEDILLELRLLRHSLVLEGLMEDLKEPVLN